MAKTSVWIGSIGPFIVDDSIPDARVTATQGVRTDRAPVDGEEVIRMDDRGTVVPSKAEFDSLEARVSALEP